MGQRQWVDLMASHRNQWVGPPDFSTCDRWAVDVVVTEGVKVNLNDDELLLAVIKLRERDPSMGEDAFAARLHISHQKAWAVLRRFYRWEEAERKKAMEPVEVA